MVLRSEQRTRRTALDKSKGLQALYSDFLSGHRSGQTLCLKMDGTLFLGQRKNIFRNTFGVNFAVSSGIFTSILYQIFSKVEMVGNAMVNILVNSAEIS